MPDSPTLLEDLLALIALTEKMGQALAALDIPALQALIVEREPLLSALKQRAPEELQQLFQKQPELKTNLMALFEQGTEHIDQTQHLLDAIQEQLVQLTAGKRASYAYIGKDDAQVDTSMFFEDKG